MGKNNHLTYEIMVDAARTCNPSYDGKFWLGVKTTKIYCLPSCKAKFPLEKNILFFSTREDAVKNGYRGCKRCKSEFFPFVEPDWIEKIKEYMNTHLDRKVIEAEIVSIANVDISTVRRIFKFYQKMSLMAYHRQLRMTLAKKLLEQGVHEKELHKMVGYKSRGGFNNAFKHEHGKLPEEYL